MVRLMDAQAGASAFSQELRVRSTGFCELQSYQMDNGYCSETWHSNVSEGAQGVTGYEWGNLV